MTHLIAGTLGFTLGLIVGLGWCVWGMAQQMKEIDDLKRRLGE